MFSIRHPSIKFYSHNILELHCCSISNNLAYNMRLIFRMIFTELDNYIVKKIQQDFNENIGHK